MATVFIVLQLRFCFVSTTETICEVHVGLLLVCVRINGVVHNMHNVFTVCFIAMCTVLENASQCHTRVTVFTEHTENCVYIFHCKSMYSAMSVHGQSSAVHSMLIGYLPILLLFVYFLWFFLFLMVQTVKSVCWLESTSITYVMLKLILIWKLLVFTCC